MSTAKKTKSPANKKPAAPKAVKTAPAKKAPAKPVTPPKTKTAPAKAKAEVKRVLKPKPKATNPSKKDVGIFGAIQKNIQEGIAVITETILPAPKKKTRKR